MKFYRQSTNISLVFIWVIFGSINLIYAEDSNAIPTMKILWQKEITADSNLNCSLGPVAFDKTTKKLLISGTSFRPKMHRQGKLWLMNVDANSGSLNKILSVKDFNESRATTPVSLAVSMISSLTVSENNSIAVVGKFGNFGSPAVMKIGGKGNKSKFIDLANKNNEPNKNNQEDFGHIYGGLNLSDDNLLLMGGGKEGCTVLKVDSEGIRLWKRSYKIGKGKADWFTNVIENGNDFVAVGCSANPAQPNSPFPDITGENFILKSNVNGDIKAKDIFNGNPWPGMEPVICVLTSGDFAVAYGKSMTMGDFNVRLYASDLKLLWEKQTIESQRKKPGTIKIAATQQNNFVVAANIDSGNLRVFEYDEEGKQIASFSADKEVWLINLGLVCVDNKALVIYQTRPNSEKGENLSKIKIIALELK
jgi:hypothetical protein